MKVEVKNPNGILQRAWVETPTPLATILCVDSDFKMPRPSSYGFDTDDKGMEINDYTYWSDDASEPDVVTITAETKEECQVLKRTVFEWVDKRFQQFMYCHKSVYIEKGDKE